VFHVECKACGTSAYVDCVCPTIGHNPAAAGVHALACPMSDLGATVTCPPGSPCCDGSSHPDQSHDEHANSCPRGHGACAVPDACPVWSSEQAGTRHPLYEGEPPGPCPGGHCAPGAAGCTVCRPVTITVMPGATVITAVSA
jgi:hypothetical protein